jgi:hypothetical protein
MTKAIVVAIVALLLAACEGFVGEASLKASDTSGTVINLPVEVAKKVVPRTEPGVDPRQITARFEGADEAAMVNPGMDYRFVLALTNNSDRVVTSVRGVLSIRSASGSDLLVNHPYSASNLRLLPRGTERVSVEVPVASDIASRSTLRFEIVSAEAP